MVVETYPMDAPKSFEHILALVKKRFYDNQAVHRVVAGQAVQFGDPQSRNMMLVDWWGRGPNSGSGSTIGVSEVSKTRKHRRHAGHRQLRLAGSRRQPDVHRATRRRELGRQCTIIGQVTSGIEVADKLARGDKSQVDHGATGARRSAFRGSVCRVLVGRTVLVPVVLGPHLNVCEVT